MSEIATVAVGIIVREGCALLTRRRDDDRFAGQWEFPGGKIDPGETPHAALVRELKEEIGAAARVLGPYQFAYHEYERDADDPRGPLRVLLLFYLTEIDGEPEPLEVAEARWVRIPELTRWDVLKGSLGVIDQLIRDHDAGLL